MKEAFSEYLAAEEPLSVFPWCSGVAYNGTKRHHPQSPPSSNEDIVGKTTVEQLCRTIAICLSTFICRVSGCSPTSQPSTLVRRTTTRKVPLLLDLERVDTMVVANLKTEACFGFCQ